LAGSQSPGGLRGPQPRPTLPSRGPRGTGPVPPERWADLRALADADEEGVILADDEGRILYANPAAARILGCLADALVGRIGFELCHPDHLAVAEREFARALAAPRTAVAFEVDVLTGDGAPRRVAVQLVNHLETTAVQAVVVRFHAVAPAPPAAEGPGDEYRVLFEQAPMGLGVAARDGTLLAFNEAILTPGGYTREDILRLGNVARLYCHAGERDRVLALAAEQGFVWREPVQFKRKDGTCYDTLLSLVPVRFAGQDCWYAVHEDVADRRLLEDQLRQAQKMEEIGQLAGGIAHDFNNLVSIILLYTGMATQAADAGRPVDRADLASIEAAARQAAAMTGKLLGFSRRAHLAPAPTDLGAVARGVGGILRRMLPEHITIDIRAEPATPAALVDPGAVEQMLVNLATNARDAMPEGGTLRVTVEPVTLDAAWVAAHPGARTGAYVRLEVADTGTGMDEATRRQAFNPFFTTKPPGQGTGLGLALVYGLTKQQQGFVELTSEMGHGTVVRVYLPAVEGAARPAPARVRDEVRGGSETILVVEDDALLRASLRRVLSAFGYTVLIAEDGADALEVYRAEGHRIALVISDLVMPRMGGPQLYEALRREASPPRFVFVSGYGGEYSPPRAEGDRDVPFIQKPWELRQLLTTVRGVLDG
jgi:PAS domain S-box-containing protein